MAQDPGAAIVQLGQTGLDLRRGVLLRDGQVIALRAKPFRLLCELAGQPGCVVSKQALLDAVWPDVAVTEASLSQAVHDARRALGDAGGQILRTVARLHALPNGASAGRGLFPASRPRRRSFPRARRLARPHNGQVPAARCAPAAD